MAENSEVGIDVQNKFAFYVVALVFTILGLSVETADFGSSRFADAAELFAWLALLVSGLCGLRRIELMPSIYRLAGLDVSGKEAREVLERGIQEKQDAGLRYYYAHKTLFILGLVALITARGYKPFLGLFS